MLFVSTCTLLGIVSANRIFIKFNNENVFTKKQMTNFGTLYLVFILLLLNFLNFSQVLYFFLVFFPQFLIFGISFIVKSLRKRNFQNIFINFLEVLLLKMYIGMSFRDAFSDAKHKINKKYEDIFNQIEEFVVFPQRDVSEIKDSFIKEIIISFRKVDLNSHNSTERVEFYLQKCKIKENFRRKSSVITTQTRLQTIVLIVLYLILMTFQLLKFGFFGSELIYLTSFSLFLTGIIVYWLTYRKQMACVNT